ncbi:FAD:protein FMN transferase [Christiangramia fulva]|uniref:FAD:protein FMN transferase n=1 Tax=Christiangramia fulva TaxID=2126553 RepID=A0A2R3Z5K6_9FLAO|nr:FAD:protein FMN transferase [Christiangramia fulva]AVR45550.1 FAD:protein FMN transferase [Christiangramia fulva]
MLNRFFLIFIFFGFISCNDQEKESHMLQGEALGTTYSIRYFSDKDFDFEKGLDSIYESINSSMSTYRTSSDISKINRGDTTVRVDENFRKVFEASGKIYKESNGFFDPTVGELVNAYGFGPGKQLRELDSITLDSLRGLVGLDKVSIDKNNKISKEDPRVYLDFNAIAKGYTIDVIGQYLDSEGVENYLIELGGELLAKGENLERGSEWIVGIDDPMQEAAKRELKAMVKLKNNAMATSGNYRKFRVDSITGQKFVHTINPLSGKAERSNLLSASVITDKCMIADGYATTFMAMGLERSKEMLKRLKNVDVYLVYSSEDGEVNTYITPGFQKLLLE